MEKRMMIDSFVDNNDSVDAIEEIEKYKEEIHELVQPYSEVDQATIESLGLIG